MRYHKHSRSVFSVSGKEHGMWLSKRASWFEIGVKWKAGLGMMCQPSVLLAPTPAGQHRVSKGFGDDSVTGYILLVFQVVLFFM